MKNKIHSQEFDISFYGLSDIGTIRENNEDLFLALSEYMVFAVADGMGGHRDGEIAAQEALDFLKHAIEELYLTESDFGSDIHVLCSKIQSIIADANAWIHHLNLHNPDEKGMGTTLSSLLFFRHIVVIGHVGDSRIYRLRAGLLEQLTFDHSLKNELIIQGQEDKANKYKNVLTRSIGIHKEVIPEIEVVTVSSGDVYLLCSDGLTDYVSDDQIQEVLCSELDQESQVLKLIDTAKKLKSQDNITALIVNVE